MLYIIFVIRFLMFVVVSEHYKYSALAEYGLLVHWMNRRNYCLLYTLYLYKYFKFILTKLRIHAHWAFIIVYCD